MKKLSVIGTAVATALVASSMSVTAFAASNPADDTSNYGFTAGEQSYQSRMAESPSWYNNEDESVTSGYSFNTGSQASQFRNDAFAGMPIGDGVSKEQVESWFDSVGMGAGSVWSDGQYNESAKSNYGYSAGQTAYQQRHAAFSESN